MKSCQSVYSMTAFARTQHHFIHEQSNTQFAWELRSVNQRYLEINFRMNDNLRHLEMPIRQQLKAHFARGKIDVSLSIKQSTSASMQINMATLHSLNQAICEVQMQLPEATALNPLEILQWPGVLQEQNNPLSTDDQALDKALLSGLEQAIEDLKAHRAREGSALKTVIEQRCDSLESILESLQPILSDIQAAQVSKTRQRLATLQTNVDEQRLHQEIALLAQKIDIAEELDRLALQIKEVRHVLNSGEPMGRRLDFLMQELNREANTLGSKSVDSRTSQASVDLKVLIEQMREQVQNIE
ncbi:hypothetical protein THMIRHAS_23640 [Thiosulfatimonas sediminis]|uniref:YicC family protein n=1 Tax=Thiosulfatimonas sediminis TaxID=2675054 RepID=A0A6F8PXZ2_9GAMM|nr:YicC/YloC family endoribonuclease [Thiosulfatimonas sediminis]BBP46991.1 hypothetical protein THMIRHAS_23640 [Thiosulfatimonas sediminis]